MGATGNKLLIAGVVIAMGVWAFLHWTSDERRIQRQLDRLAETLDKQSGEESLASAAKARRLRNLFAAEFEVVAKQYGLVLRDGNDLGRAAFQYRSQVSSLSVDLGVRDLVLGPGGRTATGEVDAVMLSDLAGEPGREGYRLAASWRRQEGDWKLESLELLEVIDAPNWAPL